MILKSLSWSSVVHTFTRKKIVNYETKSELAKVLTTLDLTALGVGGTLGVGVYVLAGDVAKNTAGPAVTLSFFIAAITSILAGLCYAEFGARVPKAGSAYVYSYVCIGELFAFIIGWNLILEYLIGAATVTKALFSYMDELTSHKMLDFFKENLPMNAPEISSYADIFSFLLALLFSIAIAFGARESSLVNNVFTLVNLTVVTTVIIAGLIKSHPSNWALSKEEVPSDAGKGGYAPYGIEGIIKGAARCFYAFIGFDCIATAGEEAKNPKKSIPIGVVGSLLIVFVAYFGTSTVITMMLPYYDQNPNAPLPYVFKQVGIPALTYFVSVGALCGLLASLLGSMFPLPRIIYAMASDGLIFKFLATVHPKFKTPMVGTLIAGFFVGVLACLFDLDKLQSMMSIGTLLAYSMVAACVLILRYDMEETDKKYHENDSVSFGDFFRQIFTFTQRFPSKASSTLVVRLVFFYFCFTFVFAGLISGFMDKLTNKTPWFLAILAVLLLILFCILLVVSFQPKSSVKLSFSVPLVPWIPGVSILVNIYLMTTLPTETWEKYAYWMIIGLVIYFSYGIRHSSERKINKEMLAKERG